MFAVLGTTDLVMILVKKPVLGDMAFSTTYLWYSTLEFAKRKLT